MTFCVGDRVQKVEGYKFPGIVIAKVRTTKRYVRYVVDAQLLIVQACFKSSQLISYSSLYLFRLSHLKSRIQVLHLTSERNLTPSLRKVNLLQRSSPRLLPKAANQWLYLNSHRPPRPCLASSVFNSCIEPITSSGLQLRCSESLRRAANTARAFRVSYHKAISCVALIPSHFALIFSGVKPIAWAINVAISSGSRASNFARVRLEL